LEKRLQSFPSPSTRDLRDFCAIVPPERAVVLRLVCVFWTAVPETVVHVEFELSFENISKRATFNLVPATVRRVET
jgi:hypothetical protein